MMLEMMWARGDIMIVGRDGQQRIWDLAERRLPRVRPMPAAALAREVVSRRLADAGIERRRYVGWLFDGTNAPGWERAVDALIREGSVVPTTVEGTKGEWLVDAAAHGGGLRGVGGLGRRRPGQPPADRGEPAGRGRPAQPLHLERRHDRAAAVVSATSAVGR